MEMFKIENLVFYIKQLNVMDDERFTEYFSWNIQFYNLH